MSKFEPGTEYADVPLHTLTSWGIGGTAKRLYVPASFDDLAAYLANTSEESPFWLGLGSNLLVSDQGLQRRPVILTQGLQKINALSDGGIYVEAGVPCAKVSRLCAQLDRRGGAFFVCIPGTIGGALAMNAGALVGETWQHVVRVCVLTHARTIEWVTPEHCCIAYRHVTHPYLGFLAAVFDFPSAEGSVEDLTTLLQKRKATQPIGQRSCGSVFKNPPGDFSARLIESCGLKGHRVGDAEVSTKHANFIINRGDATSAQIVALMQTIMSRVWAECQVRLAPEVKWVSDSGEQQPW